MEDKCNACLDALVSAIPPHCYPVITRHLVRYVFVPRTCATARARPASHLFQGLGLTQPGPGGGKVHVPARRTNVLARIRKGVHVWPRSGQATEDRGERYPGLGDTAG
jgi:hypothetical protein